MGRSQEPLPPHSLLAYEKRNKVIPTIKPIIHRDFLKKIPS
jgi:hypothetical protein